GCRGLLNQEPSDCLRNNEASALILQDCSWKFSAGGKQICVGDVIAASIVCSR
ncbi:unnamed protein product, partial [Linum tenue]